MQITHQKKTRLANGGQTAEPSDKAVNALETLGGDWSEMTAKKTSKAIRRPKSTTKQLCPVCHRNELGVKRTINAHDGVWAVDRLRACAACKHTQNTREITQERYHEMYEAWRWWKGLAANVAKELPVEKVAEVVHLAVKRNSAGPGGRHE